jgi:hypothetical protein
MTNIEKAKKMFRSRMQSNDWVQCTFCGRELEILELALSKPNEESVYKE